MLEMPRNSRSLSCNLINTWFSTILTTWISLPIHSVKAAVPLDGISLFLTPDLDRLALNHDVYRFVHLCGRSYRCHSAGDGIKGIRRGLNRWVGVWTMETRIFLILAQ